MTSLNFYTHVRVDGTVHTGIDYGRRQFWEHLIEGDAEEDPTILWFVDVRCEMEEAPAHAAAAREWFVDHGDYLREQVRAAADAVHAGVDFRSFPFIHRFQNPPPDVAGAVVSSALTRMACLDLPKRIRGVADNWSRSLDDLVVNADELIDR